VNGTVRSRINPSSVIVPVNTEGLSAFCSPASWIGSVMEFYWQPINNSTEKATMVNKRFFISHSFVFVDDLLNKNSGTNKRNKGWDYLVTM
jgi:hypothetical protein